MKLGVLTGGSDAPGLNAVVRAVVRTAVFRYGSDVVGIADGFEGLLRPPQVWPLSLADVRGLVRRGGTILGASNRGSPFAASGHDRSHEVLESVRWLGLEGVICIGGDGSLAIARALHARGVPVVGIPKTVDNDIRGTGVTFGYATAVAIAVDAIDKLQTTRERHHRVMYLEVTGRQAGWVALSAGIAGGADVVLVPEFPFDPAAVAERVRARQVEGQPCTVVVVAEGAHPRGGTSPVAAPGEVALHVARAVAALADVDFRVTVLGHLLRGGDPTAHDRILATRFGAAAVRACHEGRFGTMVAIRGSEVVLVPLPGDQDPKAIEPAHELVWTATSLGVSFGGHVPPGGGAAAAASP